MPSLEEQVAEVQLIRASTADEEFEWRGSADEIRAWEALLAGDEVTGVEIAPLAFALKLDDGNAALSHLWLNVNYRLEGEVELTLQGPDLSRHDLDRIKQVIDERQKEASTEGFDNIVFDVYTAVQAYLTEEPVEVSTSALPAKIETTEIVPAVDRNVKMSRVIFWTHHLKAPSKKRDMTAWCSELSLWGLVKSGYPGYLCFEGEEGDVQEMVRRIKALQWHAIMVKTEEPYTFKASDGVTTMNQVRDEAVRHCLLANIHERQEADSKLRTTMIEVESGKELVERLRSAGVSEDEYRLALNLRKA